MADLETIKKRRRMVRASFTKLANDLTAILQHSTPDVEETHVAMQILDEKFVEFRNLNIEIFSLLLEQNVTEADLEEETKGCDNYSRRFKQLSIKSEKIWQEKQQADQVSSSSSVPDQAGKRKFKLPEIQFKKFGGNIRDWLSFWAHFKKVDEDPSIDLADKVPCASNNTW